jgi:Tfp pilus assembly protein PilO
LKDLKAQISKNQKLIIYGLIAFCAVAADFTLFLKPTLADLKKTLPEIAKLKRRLTAAKSARLDIPGLNGQIKDLNERLSSYNKKFSTKEEKASLLEELSSMAKESDVKILAVKPYTPVVQQPQAAGGAYQKFPILIKAKAGYHQLGTFINKLENASTFMRITYLKITGNAQTPMEHDAELVVNTYILTEGG